MSAALLQIPLGSTTLHRLPQVHATYQRRLYHFSWCSQPGQVFSQSAARDFCRALGQVVVGNEEFDFDLYGVDRTTDYSFFLELLRQSKSWCFAIRLALSYAFKCLLTVADNVSSFTDQITSFWTRDRASTAPYVVRGSITRLVLVQPCLWKSLKVPLTLTF